MPGEQKRQVIELKYSKDEAEATQKREEQESKATMADFKKMVEQEAGQSFDKIEQGVPDNLLDHQILVKGTGEASGWYLVGHVEYEDEEKSKGQYFTNLLVVDASKT